MEHLVVRGVGEELGAGRDGAAEKAATTAETVDLLSLQRRASERAVTCLADLG
jgi:hypothetical protein